MLLVKYFDGLYFNNFEPFTYFIVPRRLFRNRINLLTEKNVAKTALKDLTQRHTAE